MGLKEKCELVARQHAYHRKSILSISEIIRLWSLESAEDRETVQELLCKLLEAHQDLSILNSSGQLFPSDIEKVHVPLGSDGIRIIHRREEIIQSIRDTDISSPEQKKYCLRRDSLIKVLKDESIPVQDFLTPPRSSDSPRRRPSKAEKLEALQYFTDNIYQAAAAQNLSWGLNRKPLPYAKGDFLEVFSEQCPGFQLAVDTFRKTYQEEVGVKFRSGFKGGRADKLRKLLD